LMQAQYAPTIISRDRYKGAMLAKKLGYDLIIMDDGFQNPQLKKDLSFIVIDGGFGFGNGHVFPSGPLRETVEIGVKRATASIIINRTDSIDTKRLGALKQFDAKIILENTSENQNNKKIIAFAGISRPEKFFNTLEENGYKLHAHYGFPDHKPYTHGQLKKLVSMAGKSKSTLMTTEKDWIRLSDKWRSQISYLKIRIDLGDNFTTYLNAQLDKLS
jgi:tetraacyldisaccharide 4'-kinase